MNLDALKKALIEGCQSFIHEVLADRHPEIKMATEDDKKTLIDFETAVSEIIKAGNMSEAQGSRLAIALTRVDTIFAPALPSTKLWFAGLRSFLPQVVAHASEKRNPPLSKEIVEELRARRLPEAEKTERLPGSSKGFGAKTSFRRRRLSDMEAERLEAEEDSADPLL